MSTVCEYDTDGKLVKSYNDESTSVYEYDDDGNCVLIRTVMVLGEYLWGNYKEIETTAYGHKTETSYQVTGDDYDNKEIMVVQEFLGFTGDDVIRDVFYQYDEDGTFYEIDELIYQEDGTQIHYNYDVNGRKVSEIISKGNDYENIVYNEDGSIYYSESYTYEDDTAVKIFYDAGKKYRKVVRKIIDGDDIRCVLYNANGLKIMESYEYAYNNGGNRLITYYDANGNKVQDTTYDENGTASIVHYNEDGSVAPYPTHIVTYSSEGIYVERFRYDKNGKITEVITYNEAAQEERIRRYNKKELLVSDAFTNIDGVLVRKEYEYTYGFDGEVSGCTIKNLTSNTTEICYVNEAGELVEVNGSVLYFLSGFRFDPPVTSDNGYFMD